MLLKRGVRWVSVNKGRCRRKLARKEEPYNIDADLHNADWPKRTWDLPPWEELTEEQREALRALGRAPEEVTNKGE